MMFVSGCAIGLLLFGADPAEELRFESALLTLIEHADVSASDTGLLSTVAVKEGLTVEEGTPLAGIDDRDAKLVVSRTETELKIAQSIVENDIKLRFAKLTGAVANAELQRAIDSNAQLPKSVSKTEMERLKLLAEKATLEIQQAEIEQQQSTLSLKVKQQEFDRATLALERKTIKAPFAGMVVQWKKHRGEWVEPGTPVLRLIQLNRLRAETFVVSQKLPGDLVGRSVTLTANPTGKKPVKCTGKLVFVSPELDPVNGQVRIWAEIENEDLSLRPGQTGTLSIGAASTRTTTAAKPQ